jgi:aryl-alcohol dehydrogenase-like predicted oxidoreductase
VSEAVPVPPPAPATQLRTRRLGNTGLTLGEVALGTWGLCGESYGRVFPDQRERTLARAIDQGFTVFDMAPSWGEDGASEREVAKAVGERREQTTYITRAGQAPGEHGLSPAFGAAQLEAECEASLRRLATDRIEVWLLHEPSETELRMDETRGAAEKLKQAGKVRAWGASVSQLDTARSALEAGVEVLCVPFNLLRQELVRELAADVSARGVGLIVHSVLGYGLLAGRWGPKKRFLNEDHRSQRWLPDTLAERVQQTSDLRYLVQGPVLSLASASVRFALAHDVVSCAVLGPRTPGQVEAAVQGLAGEPYLPEELLARARKRP